jgi:DNA processing protein
MNKEDQILYQIALTMIPNVGPVLARILLSYCGSLEAIFKLKASQLEKIPDIGPVTARSIARQKIFHLAEAELKNVLRKKVKVLFYLDDDFPNRLKQCNDAPILLYFKGNMDFNKQRYLGIVGTRKATEYGKYLTEKLVEDCAGKDIVIVSGMAYGIDICAHKAALKYGLPTVGVMAHGLDRIYPPEHTEVARDMTRQGGVLTEYPFNTDPDRENFPSRNRIVAGLCDAIVVVEAAEKGGALITADIANSYSRDVFAFPGRTNDPYSLGCNKFIRDNRAGLISGASDLLRMMSWDEDKKGKKKKPAQQQLFVELSEEEEKLMKFVTREKRDIDSIALDAGMPMSKVSSLLFALEMKGVIRAFPGKQFVQV